MVLMLELTDLVAQRPAMIVPLEHSLHYQSVLQSSVL